MKRLCLLIPLIPLVGWAHFDWSDPLDSLTRRTFGDNYGPVFTGETRAEYREREALQPSGYRNYYSTVDPPH